MLLPHTKIENIPVMSLQTGGELARTARPIIDPRNLSIIAFELTGEHLDVTPSLLLIQDIREISSMGYIVDSSDEFVGVEDVIKVHEVYNFDFRLLDIPVIDRRKHKLGTVSGFAYETDSFEIQQLNVKRPFFKSFTDTEKLVHRSQIVAIQDDAIVVESLDQSSTQPLPRLSNYSNPFRSPNAPQPDTIQRRD